MSKLDLDHVGIAVRSLDAAAVHFERLGFQLTPPSTRLIRHFPLATS